MKNIIEVSLSTLTSIVASIAVLSPLPAHAFRPSPDQVIYSYSLPDGTPVCVVMNHANTRSEPDGMGGWRFVPDPQPIALDCRNGAVIVEEHVPVPRPEPTPAPAPEPEPTPEEIKAEQCRQIREGAREGAMEGMGDSWGPGAAIDVEILSVIACAVFL